ncbi:hypothetical protein GCM10022419_087770 [Nonomuraea rosea]|uniref:Uncharacterized protein n=1 Tax=Nonomuraea rosea TaxID=638574 RepID=A0ABP6YXC8_9ACTN
MSQAPSASSLSMAIVITLPPPDIPSFAAVLLRRERMRPIRVVAPPAAGRPPLTTGDMAV